MKKFTITFALKHGASHSKNLMEYVKDVAEHLGGATLPPANTGAYTMKDGELVIEPSFTLIGYGEATPENVEAMKSLALRIRNAEEQESVLFNIEEAPYTEFI